MALLTRLWFDAPICVSQRIAVKQQDQVTELALKHLLIAALIATVLASPVLAQQSLICVVNRKFDAQTGENYTPERLEELQFGAIVDLYDQTLSRCSFVQSAGRVTCDTYPIDRMEVAAGYVDIVKYYYFNGHFDLQIFNGSTFVENNGRGSIASGTCYPM